MRQIRHLMADSHERFVMKRGIFYAILRIIFALQDYATLGHVSKAF